MDLKDLLLMLEKLPRVGVGDGYSATARAADFIAVFRGQSSAEQGERVLTQIVDFCTPAPNPLDADKPGTLAFKEGKRWVLTEIMRAFIPQERIAQVESTKRGTKDVRRGN